MQKTSLTFGVESNSGHWSKIFEGFDQESILTTRFKGKSPKSVELLYKFGSIVYKYKKNFTVEPHSYGIVIKTTIDEKDKVSVSKWMDLMKTINNEINKIGSNLN